MGNTLFPQNKGQRKLGDNMAERLAPGHLRLLPDEQVFARHRGNITGPVMVALGRHPFFVFCDPVPYQITLCIYRSRKRMLALVWSHLRLSPLFYCQHTRRPLPL